MWSVLRTICIRHRLMYVHVSFKGPRVWRSDIKGLITPLSIKTIIPAAEPAQLHTRTHTRTHKERWNITILCHSRSTFPHVAHSLSITLRLPLPIPLSLSFPPSFTLAPCEGHAIDFPLSIHFSVLVLKRGKQTKAISPQPAHRTSPRSRRSHPLAPPGQSAGPGFTFQQCAITVTARLIPVHQPSQHDRECHHRYAHGVSGCDWQVYLLTGVTPVHRAACLCERVTKVSPILTIVIKITIHFKVS